MRHNFHHTEEALGKDQAMEGDSQTRSQLWMLIGFDCRRYQLPVLEAGTKLIAADGQNEFMENLCW